tara:strand:- start:344 stop:517 length:174 start_codon:yes stop_codon:yes gene_type:complete
MESRTYEDMSKRELITLVERLSKQHEEWRRQALGLDLTPFEALQKATSEFPPIIVEG